MGYDCMTEYDSATDLYYQSLEEEIACCLDDDIPF